MSSCKQVICSAARGMGDHSSVRVCHTMGRCWRHGVEYGRVEHWYSLDERSRGAAAVRPEERLEVLGLHEAKELSSFHSTEEEDPSYWTWLT